MVTAVLTLAAAALAAAFATSASAAPLDAFQWTARPVVVFAPGPGDAAAADQIARLRQAHAALRERDMPVLVVLPDRVTALDGGGAPGSLDAEALRKAYGVARKAFGVILVGKDSGEKFRSGVPVDADRLLELVDGMPMRRNEAR